MSPTAPDHRDETRTAIVIGGSLAGMMAAHVASRRFERVLVIERGAPPSGTAPRRSVPQERHVHLLLQRGKRVLESLFPGFLAELESRGAVVADASRDIAWYQRDRWKRRVETGIYTHYCSRALIDDVVRRRLAENPRVTFVYDTRVTGLLPGAAPGTAGGVVTESGPLPAEIPADLVIDAGGRGSRAAEWIEALGAAPVRTSLVTSRLGYGSRIYKKRPEFDRSWKVLLVLPRPPASRRMGVISPIEGDRWMVTAGGWLGDCPGAGASEFLDYLHGLPDRSIHSIIRDAEPLSEVSVFRIPGSLRRRYEEVAGFPGRFLVIGDAVCSFNPIYSQGMTVTALQIEALAAELDGLLAAGLGPSAAHAVQRRIASVVDAPWAMAESEDLRFPEVAGDRTWELRLQHLYGSLVADASAVDGVVLRSMLQVINLIEPPARLEAPDLRARVLASALRARLGARVEGP